MLLKKGISDYFDRAESKPSFKYLFYFISERQIGKKPYQDKKVEYCQVTWKKILTLEQVSVF